MQKLLIETTTDNARFFENEAYNLGLTFSQLFDSMIKKYRISESTGTNAPNLIQDEETGEIHTEPPTNTEASPDQKRRGRPKIYH